MRPLSQYGLFLFFFVVLTTGCDQGGIQVYTVPKEQLPQVTQGNLSDDHPDLRMMAVPPLKWKTPAGWQELPAGEFRVASFKVTGRDAKQADVSVIPLPGVAGGDFSNVNRWRGQVGLPPVSEEEVKKLVQPVEVAAQPAVFYEQDGKNSDGEPMRILAVIQHREDTAWFFKMTGDSQLVEQEKPSFIEFLKSVQFAATETAPSASSSKPQWTAPPGWKEAPAGQFLIAKFLIAGESNAQAAVNVSASTGNGGGVVANVNRWRKQLGLSELTGNELAKSLKPIETSNSEATLVEMNGQDVRNGQPVALVGVMVFRPGQAWFYKLMGDTTIVTSQKESFIKFVQEVKY